MLLSYNIFHDMSRGNLYDKTRTHSKEVRGSSSTHTQRAFKLISFSPKSTGHALEDDITYNELRVFKNAASNFLKIK